MLQETTVGSMNYNVLANIIRQGNILQHNLAAEIGVLYGDTSAYLLKEFPGLQLLCIDPYLEYNEPGVERSQKTMTQYEEIARGKIAEFGDRGAIIKDFSLNVAPKVENGALDFVFIDANHDYEYVAQDIEAWYPKVRSGGLFAGHDYKSWPGVTKAVDEFMAAQKVQGFFTPIASDIWFFVKP